MTRQIAVIAYTKNASARIKSQLEGLLGEYLEISAYSLESGVGGKISCDICLAPAEDISSQITDVLLPNTRVLPVRRTISSQAWNLVAGLPQGTRVLLVNTSRRFVDETIMMLLREGANHLEYIPCYPGSPLPEEKIRVAITPNELSLVPSGVEEIINIGNRMVDTQSFIELAATLDILSAAVRRRITAYSVQLLHGGTSSLPSALDHELGNAILSTLTEDADCAVLLHAPGGEILYRCGCERFVPKGNGSMLSDYLPDPRYGEMRAYYGDSVVFGGREYWLTKRICGLGGEHKAAVVALRDIARTRQWLEQYAKRGQVKSHTAKYQFSDIKGHSPAIERAVALARKAAVSGLDILLEGESGTGKELFANAIHNGSHRREAPFVAFNCAAVTQSLFESELFGYEDGAFTGARRGGRSGLIEAANGGTLFLDEIGELIPEMQAKLLRVLQEREIIRVGGTTRIPVDVRIIAATNHDLHSQVASGRFRLDLFYRLSVVQLRLPPLRERREDIPLLIHELAKGSNMSILIPNEVLTFLQRQAWPGNHRELRNFCQYMFYMEESFSLDAVWEYFYVHASSPTQLITSLPSVQGMITDDVELEILLILSKCHEKHIKIGRKRIAEELTTRGFPRTEPEVRTLLTRLSAQGCVLICKGRGGTCITPDGLHRLESRVVSQADQT